LNRQNGLFEQYARIFNPTPSSFPNGVRLFVSIAGFDTTNKVYNATGTNAGVAYIDIHQELHSGAFVDVLIQYYVPNPRSVPDVTLTAEPILYTISTTPSPVLTASRADGGIVLRFTTAKDRLYYLQATEDMARWHSLPGLISGNGNEVSRTNSVTGGEQLFRVLILP